MPIILQNYKSVAYTHFCHSHVENGFKMNRVLIKVLSPIRVWSVKKSFNEFILTYCKFWNRKIYNYHGTYAFYKVMSFFYPFFFLLIKYSWSFGICIQILDGEMKDRTKTSQPWTKVVNNKKNIYICKSWICEICIHFAKGQLPLNE